METAAHRAWQLVRFTAPAVLLLGAAGGNSVGAAPPLPLSQIHGSPPGWRGRATLVGEELESRSASSAQVYVITGVGSWHFL